MSLSLVEQNKKITKERKKSSSNRKESITPLLPENLSSSVHHLIPNDLRDSKWQEFMRDQAMDHRIASVRDAIVNTATAELLQKRRLEKKLFEFSSQCARAAWLRLFDWIFSKPDSYSKHDSNGQPIHLIFDTEPELQLADAWMAGNVSPVFVSMLPVTINSKAKFHGLDDKGALQQQQATLENIEADETSKKKKSTVTNGRSVEKGTTNYSSAKLTNFRDKIAQQNHRNVNRRQKDKSAGRHK